MILSPDLGGLGGLRWTVYAARSYFAVSCK
jgi:hypothetical protein